MTAVEHSSGERAIFGSCGGFLDIQKVNLVYLIHMKNSGKGLEAVPQATGLSRHNMVSSETSSSGASSLSLCTQGYSFKPICDQLKTGSPRFEQARFHPNTDGTKNRAGQKKISLHIMLQFLWVRLPFKAIKMATHM